MTVAEMMAMVLAVIGLGFAVYAYGVSSAVERAAREEYERWNERAARLEDARIEAERRTFSSKKVRTTRTTHEPME